MKKFILVFALIPLMSFAQYGQRGAGGGSTFYWSLTGQAQKTDSLRIIQGSNMTITQSGNTVTFNGAAGAGSTANVRANTGWTSNGTTARDTLALAYLLNKANIRFIVADADGDTLWFYPQNLLPFVLKDGATILAAIDSTGRAGFGNSTSGQARRAILNVLGRAANDTLAIFSNDGGGVVGDSSIIFTANGGIKLPTQPSSFLVTGNTNFQLGNLNITQGGGIVDNSYGGSVIIVGTGGAVNIASANSNVIRLTPASQVIIGATATKANQAFLTVNANGTADTTFMVRNDKNATLDSTAMVFANGDGYFGGKNLYIGGHRIRSNAAGDSLIFYDGSTMIFAILSDGSTADLVAGVPPTLWRNISPREYIWLLRLGVSLPLLLVAFKIYNYVKLRVRKHKTLSSEI